MKDSFSFPFLSTTPTTTMNTTYDETSELSSPKINMAPTTTFAKSKKGVVVLLALCMMFFYTGRLRLSSSSGGRASLDASLLLGFQRDVVGFEDDNTDPCAEIDRIMLGKCKPKHQLCLIDSVCASNLAKMTSKCGWCYYDLICLSEATREINHFNMATVGFLSCLQNNWDNPSTTRGKQCMDGARIFGGVCERHRMDPVVDLLRWAISDTCHKCLNVGCFQDVVHEYNIIGNMYVDIFLQCVRINWNVVGLQPPPKILP